VKPLSEDLCELKNAFYHETSSQASDSLWQWFEKDGHFTILPKDFLSHS
jgi:hypothetical protein